jgi:putative ATP-dependent endonuclease of the OLD family
LIGEKMPAPVGTRRAEVLIESVIVRNFRGISEVRLELGPNLTVLLGRNNIGKSRLLRAIAVALGAAGDVDDFTVGTDENPKVDVVARPTPDDDGRERPFNPAIEELLNPAVVDAATGVVRWAYRCTLERTEDGTGVRANRRVLTYNAGTGMWDLSEAAERLRGDQFSLLEGAFIDARRDLALEINTRGTAAQRVLSDLEIEDVERQRIEGELEALGGDIVAASGSLGAMSDALRKGDKVTAGFGTPSLAPLPLRLEELSRALSLDLDSGSGPLPVRFHGSGPRSLASVLVQQVVYERRLGAGGTDAGVHPVTLLEEPEAHLHPQLQQSLPELLQAVPGQVIASTHSTHFAAELPPAMLRLLKESDGELVLVDLTPVEGAKDASDAIVPLTREEYEKFRRLIERPLGELLFADAVVIGDGATERALLPPLLAHALGARARGVVAVDPGSMNHPLAQTVVKFADAVGMPWFLFADGDDAGRKAVKSILKSRGCEEDEDSCVAFAHGDGTTEDLLIEFDEGLCQRALDAVRPLDVGETLLEGMARSKGGLGRHLAQELVDGYPDQADWPDALQALCRMVGDALVRPDDAAEQHEPGGTAV